jgi:NAD(P)-dependent dehydrogenase (short-subunit alcohol dehydrogenase family)
MARKFLRMASLVGLRAEVVERLLAWPRWTRSGKTRCNVGTGGTLQGQVAVVTGASSGLGRATAIALAGAGAHIALVARSEPELEQVAAGLRSEDVRVLPLAVDLADALALIEAAERVISELGRVDLLVNSAATDVPGPVEHLSVEDWDRVLAVNLRAPFLLSKVVFSGMRKSGGGTIVNISSVAGRRGWANAAAYCASKFALTGFTQALNAEGKAHGIRACVIFPGAMATAWGTSSAARREPHEREPTAPTRALPPEDVAALIVWIASAPPELVINEVIATPLEEEGWP